MTSNRRSGWGDEEKKRESATGKAERSAWLDALLVRRAESGFGGGVGE